MDSIGLLTLKICLPLLIIWQHSVYYMCAIGKISCSSYCSGGGIFTQFSIVIFSGSNLFDDYVLLGDGGGLLLFESTIELDTLAGKFGKRRFTEEGCTLLMVSS